MSVPTLSLKAFTQGSPADRAAFSDALMQGLQQYGFIILADHGVGQDLLEHAYAHAEEVFALPYTVKRHYAAGMRGYTPFGTEHARDSALPDLKEFWQIGRDPAPGLPAEDFPPNVWPAEFPAFERTFSDLFAALDETGRVLLSALAPKLGLSGDYFDAKVAGGTSILRVLHYPPVPEDAPDGAVRSAAHEDINFITLLVAAKGAGLQLLDRDGSWLPVETAPNNLIVDSGDMLQRLTNGVIPSTTHRVVNPVGPNVSRYSMPFFMHPASDVSLKCLPSCEGDGAKWPEITAGEFLAERLREIGMAK
ncbi:MAG: isopenicillin N synthase family oxygenase [Phenylobacterium sp.]|uniref:isopenicillin N synthase family dioxygenase n=1 Tax=Phenylobacterium sp. TaxID=1871053 RepID=UPI0025E5B779|nr:2OG-Fe(II) oxygenase family protein [Phenylobacterium sp.]MBA4011960.1 isopenicillin N synthase family oxygenase [Phenylobacterium sp.]